MSFTLIDQCRALEEDIEEYAESFVLIGMDENLHHGAKERIIREHKFRTIINNVQELYQKLEELYTDADESRKTEIQEMGGPNAFTSFYDKLDLIKKSVKRGNEVVPRNPEDMIPEGEEGNGRYLDLFAHYNNFQNIPVMKKLEYLVFLSKFPVPEEFRMEAKRYREYLYYTETLIGYEFDFLSRIEPLRNIEAYRRDLTEKYKKLEGEAFPGWAISDVERNVEAFRSHIHLPNQQGAAEMPKGGNFCDVCKRDFHNPNVYEAHLSGKKHKKNLEKAGLTTETVTFEQVLAALEGDITKELSSEYLDRLYPVNAVPTLRLVYEIVKAKEWTLRSLCSELHDIVVNTRIHAEKKSLRTRDEILEDVEMEELDTGEDLLEDPTVANLLNLPLGWDGKPIPLWLYKLHGLSKEYKCEICGGQSYFGIKAFEQHFYQTKHAEGLKILGIRNSKHFLGVVRMEEAYRVNETIQKNRSKNRFVPQYDEEIEDAEGNVYTRGAYQTYAGQNYVG